jgi:hypothetical protein
VGLPIHQLDSKQPVQLELQQSRQELRLQLPDKLQTQAQEQLLPQERQRLRQPDKQLPVQLVMHMQAFQRLPI